MDNEYNQKRINPPVWQHDYHIQKRLYLNLKTLSSKIRNNAVVVDYGCGTSPYERLFHKKRTSYIKIDIGGNKNADISIKENQFLPLKKGSADLVLSTQVVEHVDNLSLYLSETSRILKRKGSLIISTHGIWPYHKSPDDYRRFTSRGLRSEVKKYNFKILKFYPILGPFAAVSQFRLLLLAEKLAGKNLTAKLILAILSLCCNSIIWFEDKIFPSSDNSDASVFLIWAEKK